MRPYVAEAVVRSQDAVFEVAIELARLGRRLAQVATSLPLPADVDELFEDRAPASPAVHLYGVTLAVKQSLAEAVELLSEAAQIDEVALRREFRGWEEDRP